MQTDIRVTTEIQKRSIRIAWRVHRFQLKDRCLAGVSGIGVTHSSLGTFDEELIEILKV